MGLIKAEPIFQWRGWRSANTIRNYLLRIYDKLGISSRVELVLYAVSGTDSAPIPTNE